MLNSRSSNSNSNSNSAGDTTAVKVKRGAAVYATAFAAFVAFMGIGLVDPILPLITRSLHAGPSQVEMLFVTYLGIMALANLVSGMIAPRLGSRRVILLGLGIVIVFSLLSGLSSGIGELAGWRAFWGLGNALFTSMALAVIVGFSGGSAKRGIMLYEAALGLGLAFGPLLGGMLGGFSWRYPFFGVTVLMSVAFICVATLVPNPPQNDSSPASAVLRALGNPSLLTVALSGLCYTFCFFIILGYAPLFLNLDALQLGLIFCAWGVLVGISSIFLIEFLRSYFAPVNIVLGSCVLLVIDFLAIALIHNYSVDLVLILVSGIFCGLNNASFTTLAIESSPFSRSVSSSAYNFLRWAGAAFAPLVAGIVATSGAVSLPFIIGAALLVCGIVILVLRRHHIETALEKAGDGAHGEQAPVIEPTELPV